MFKPLLFPCILLFSLSSWAQIQPVIVPASLRIPLDSVRKEQMIHSLDGFLDQTSGKNKDNPYVETSYLPETSDLMDEIKGMGSFPGRKDVCSCYLTNVNMLDSVDCLVQFSYLGTIDTTPLLRASFKLVAHYEGGRFLFSSPLRRNTVGWKVWKDDDFTFYYSNYPFDQTTIAEYVRKAREFDRKLHGPGYQTKFYCCATLQEALEALGVEYKLDYNGFSSDKFTAFEQQTSLNVLGGTRSALFDYHDLWHDRLHAVVPVSTINKPIDEACAYLYGGSWGLTWEEVFRQFKTYMGDNRDWLAAFTENKNFAQPNQNHLYVSYVITALLAKKIEEEKGFPVLIQFLTCGRYQADNENYFQALDKIIGVNRSNFNVTIEKLFEAQLCGFWSFAHPTVNYYLRHTMVLLILNVIFCLSFLYFAYLNLNDIDPWLWVPIYLAAAACCGLTVFGKFYPRIYLVLIGFYLVYAIILFFSPDGVRDWIVKYKRPSIVESMKAEKPWIEKTREFFGLLIITGALVVDYFWAG